MERDEAGGTASPRSPLTARVVMAPMAPIATMVLALLLASCSTSEGGRRGESGSPASKGDPGQGASTPRVPRPQGVTPLVVGVRPPVAALGPEAVGGDRRPEPEDPVPASAMGHRLTLFTHHGAAFLANAFDAGNLPVGSGNMLEMHECHVEWFEQAPGFGMSRVPRLPAHSPPFTVHHEGDTYAVSRPSLMGFRRARTWEAERGGWRRILVAGLEQRDGIATSVDAVDVLFEGELSPAAIDAIHALLSGSDLVLVREEHETRAIGGLRAKAACARCHPVEEGALLGALVYRLVPVRS